MDFVINAGGEKMELKEAMKEALEFEKKGKEIYEDVAKSTFNPMVKKTFEYLAREEENHIAEIMKYIESQELDREFKGACMKDVEKFFNMTINEYKGGIEFSEDDKNAYENAMDLEESSYDYYKDQRENAEDERLREFFTFVMEQENAHYLMLEKTLRFIEDPANFFVENEEWNFEG